MYKFICQLERGQIFLAPLGGGGSNNFRTDVMGSDLFDTSC